MATETKRDNLRPGAMTRAEAVREAAAEGDPDYESKQEWEKVLAEETADEELTDG